MKIVSLEKSKCFEILLTAGYSVYGHGLYLVSRYNSRFPYVILSDDFSIIGIYSDFKFAFDKFRFAANKDSIRG